MTSRDYEEMRGIPHDEPVFHISVVARMVGVHQQTLRSYERQGLLQPSRSAGNRRLYSQNDIERLRHVLRLVADLGVNLAGVDVILRMTRQIEELQAQLNDANAEIARLRAAQEGTRA
jgi:MerR family transcriptional regulator, heat shock protein HspR